MRCPGCRTETKLTEVLVATTLRGCKYRCRCCGRNWTSSLRGDALGPMDAEVAAEKGITRQSLKTRRLGDAPTPPNCMASEEGVCDLCDPERSLPQEDS